ncbi:biotin/lipoyl-binding protein [Cryobacterium sp. TMS1-20-1]|uniref:biotin/lipoyl-containing protein n=1 Tax=Cryobacterium sp. TMS1-20-1 TaxID=1259223 RepID=UPI00106DB667|nr:biotin/lipoyl-containing protein [Cryobacterium sp. TMS1-20-1]TFC78897.1 biotin/lipoyl-binding protein [Cryobacterium sp. TMS1-20-1]
MIDVSIPQWGLTMDDAVLEQWFKKVGDTVSQGESLADIETDKITSELEAPVSGVIAELLVGDGDTVTQGQIVARIDES